MKATTNLLAALLTFGVTLCANNLELLAQTVTNQQSASSAELKSPSGPAWPAEFLFREQKGKIETNKPFEVEVSLTPALFDVFLPFS